MVMMISVTIEALRAGSMANFSARSRPRRCPPSDGRRRDGDPARGAGSFRGPRRRRPVGHRLDENGNATAAVTLVGDLLHVVRFVGTGAAGDGVVDGADICANTPPGVTVDTAGCTVDSDRDGVSEDRDR